MSGGRPLATMSAAERYAQQVEKVRALQEEYEQQVKAHKHAMEAVEMARASIPKSLRERLEKAARGTREANSDSRSFLAKLDSEYSGLVTKIKEEAKKPNTFLAEEFYHAIENHLDRREFACLEKFFALYDLYLGYHNNAPPVPPHHWSGVGSVTYAPASSASVVDAVFAKLGA
jgi:hypothetical protein